MKLKFYFRLVVCSMAVANASYPTCILDPIPKQESSWLLNNLLSPEGSARCTFSIILKNKIQLITWRMPGYVG